MASSKLIGGCRYDISTKRYSFCIAIGDGLLSIGIIVMHNMGGSDKMGHPKFFERLYQCNGVLHGLGTVIDTGQDMVVDIDKTVKVIDQKFFSTEKLHHLFWFWSSGRGYNGQFRFL